MTGIMGKWPSGHGQSTKIKLPDSCQGKPLQWQRILDMVAMDLKTIWEMSAYIGNTKRSKRIDVLLPGKGWVKRGGGMNERFKVISLVERGSRARSVHVSAITASTAKDVELRNVIRKTTNLITDESRIYKTVGKQFESHQSVNHSAYEWGRGFMFIPIRLRASSASSREA